MLSGEENRLAWRPHERFRDNGEPGVTTRREVLKYAGLGVGAAAASVLGVPLSAKVAANQAQPANKPAQTEVTDKSGKRLAAGPEICWPKVAKNAAPREGTLDPTKLAQKIIGIRAAIPH